MTLLRDVQVAERLGISRRQVHRLKSAGQLPAPVRVGGGRTVRWRSADIDEFIRLGCDARAFDAAAAGPMKGILAVTREPLVSIDFQGNPYSSTVDAGFTNFYGDLVKVVTWYDNEWAYSVRVTDLAKFIVDKGL